MSEWLVLGVQRPLRGWVCTNNKNKTTGLLATGSWQHSADSALNDAHTALHSSLLLTACSVFLFATAHFARRAASATACPPQQCCEREVRPWRSERPEEREDRLHLGGWIPACSDAGSGRTPTQPTPPSRARRAHACAGPRRVLSSQVEPGIRAQRT